MGKRWWALRKGVTRRAQAPGGGCKTPRCERWPGLWRGPQVRWSRETEQPGRGGPGGGLPSAVSPCVQKAAWSELSGLSPVPAGPTRAKQMELKKKRERFTRP